MSEVILPTRYAASNYRPALDNLAQRYQKSDGEPVHYSEAGFGEISDEQSKAILRFFGNIGLLDVPKQGTYTPPDELVAWLRQMGPTEEEKAAVQEILMEYEVFDETTFVLEDEDLEFDELVSQVGSIVGIDKDEAKHLERAMEVFDDLEFVEIRENGTVSLTEDTGSTERDSGESSTNVTGERGQEEREEQGEEPDRGETPHGNEGQKIRKPMNPGTRSVSSNLEITLNATEMDAEELKAKLDIIKESFSDVGE